MYNLSTSINIENTKTILAKTIKIKVFGANQGKGHNFSYMLIPGMSHLVE